MGDQPTFSKLFHTIEGDTIQDRKKNFFKLLTNSQFSNEQQLESELKNLKPSTYLENLFYIDTLIHFKKTKELLEILKQGNEIYISKILKQDWFFATAFEDIDIEKLVNDFFPCLSFSIRKKLLWKISRCWGEEKIDDLFNATDKKYGLTMALPILNKCTATKIKSVIEENEFKLQQNQVLNLYKKSKELFMFYMNHFHKLTGRAYDEIKVLNQIASKDPELILSLEKKGIIRLYIIGRRTTKTIMAKAKDDIYKDSKRYFDFLNKSVVVRKLGKDFQLIYKQLFPRTLAQVNMYNTSSNLLKYYPKNGRWNLFIETFKEIFTNKSIEEALLKLNSLKTTLKTFNPPKAIILKWAEIHYEQQERNYNEFLKYYEPPKAVAIIKDKINVSSNISDRKSLLCLMISVCQENKDLKTLEDVLKYICFRHRNEESYTRSELLSRLSSDFQLEDFNENHWKYIDEQIKILKIQKEFSLYRFSSLIEKHVEFLIKNGKDFKIVLTEFIKDIADEANVKKINLKDLSMVKKIYIEMAKILDESTEFQTKLTRFIIMFINFSINNPEFSINMTDFPGLVSYIQKSVTKIEDFNLEDQKIIAIVINYNLKFPSNAIPHTANVVTLISQVVKENESLSIFENVLTSNLLKKDRSKVENEILDLYLQNFIEDYPQHRLIEWYIKNEPRTLTPYISQIIKTASNRCNLLDCKLIKQYSHLDFDKKTREFFIEQLNDEKQSDKNNLIDCLSILLPTEDYANIINNRYLPKKDKLDPDDNEMKDLFKLQCDILKTLTKVNEPFRTLPVVMKFCKGDFLQPALRALYSAFYRSPEKMLYSYAQTLSKQAVSARKHAVFLSCAVLDKEHTLNLLKNTDESNVSSQKYQLSATMKYFQKNPSHDLLDKVTESFNRIDINDKETLDTLKDFIVPTKFRSKYIESCWKFFEGLESKGVKNKEYLERLLGTMHEERLLKCLSLNFLLDVIKSQFSVVENRLWALDSFVLRVLRYRVSERAENFVTVFDLLAKLPKKTRSNFFREFVYIIDKTIDEDFLHSFESNWNKHFTMIDSFDDRIFLKLIVSKRQGLEAWVIFLVGYLEQLIDQFGFHCYEHFKEQFQNVLSTTKNEDSERYTVYLKILQLKVTPTTCILILDLISPVDEGEKEELRNIYRDIMNILENVDIPIVRVNYSNFIIKHSE